MQIALRFPDGPYRKLYVAAAQQFRIPYYDWAAYPARGAPALPPALSSPKVTVFDTDGQTKSIDNPLYSFYFHPLNPSPGDFSTRGKWSKIPQTVRWPDANGNSQNGLANSALANEAPTLRRNVSLLLQSYTRFMAFSNNRWLQNDKPGQYGSVENVHDTIHDTIGGPNGHMGSFDVSAFDPIFWLHHCNIDRIFAMWQALGNTSYVEPGVTGVGNFSFPKGGIENVNTPLKPFWDKSGVNFWTSEGVQSTRTFGYDYLETQSWHFKTPAEFQQFIRGLIVANYGTGNAVKDFVSNLATSPAPAAQQVKSSPVEGGQTAKSGDRETAAAEQQQLPLIPGGETATVDGKPFYDWDSAECTLTTSSKPP